ncbi:MAG: hypothetical protein HON53_21595 [Planctomycetaceae bacterium]|jgi:hypothetical protein|nr:hypothetical protein [Planctomycetaceae bacterium]MBT6155561.1 hypothetical protein [Planctomycetaceae bacterium]MBT6485838.1 hypothetical protein [Planctomycetaceae bacterium]MBT6495018.1 hypothetical protein [Planctomycetaceae bacterium]
MSQHDEFAEPKKGSSNTVLYVILAVVLVVVLICGGLAFAIYRVITGAVDTVVEVVHQATVQGIRDSDLDDDDKEKIIVQVDRVHGAYKAGDITTEQVTEILQKVFQGPIMMAGTCQHMERRYVIPSELSDEEKAEGKLTLQRVARGSFEGDISQSQFQTLTASISVSDQNGNQSLKETLTDEELREFLTQCKKLADDTKIPEEPHDIDIGEEIKKAVDEVLITE